MLRKLSSGQGRPSKKRLFGHVTRLIGENIIAAYSEKFPGYWIDLPNRKGICLMAAKLLQKENADPAKPLLPYTNKCPSRDA